jgi:hypothetical protein
MIEEVLHPFLWKMWLHGKGHQQKANTKILAQAMDLMSPQDI